MSRVRDWCKLHERWYEDEVLTVIADEHPIVLALWPVLVARCYASSHHEDNPNGTIRTSAKQLAGIVRSASEDVSAALRQLVDGEFIEASEGRLGTAEIRLARFGKYQQPKGSAASRQQAMRAGVSSDNVTEGSRSGHASVTQTEREKEKENHSPQGLESGDASEATGSVVELRPTLGGDGNHRSNRGGVFTGGGAVGALRSIRKQLGDVSVLLDDIFAASSYGNRQDPAWQAQVAADLLAVYERHGRDVARQALTAAIAAEARHPGRYIVATAADIVRTRERSAAGSTNPAGGAESGPPESFLRMLRELNGAEA